MCKHLVGQADIRCFDPIQAGCVVIVWAVHRGLWSVTNQVTTAPDGRGHSATFPDSDFL
jgi:hypothetical protein